MTSPLPDGPPAPERSPRPWVERLGLAFVATVLAALFGAVALVSWSGGEVFLAACSRAQPLKETRIEPTLGSL